MLWKICLVWMAGERRDPVYLSERCGMSPERCIAVMCGETRPDEAELAALSEVMSIPVEELRRAADATPAATAAGPQEWFSVREAAEHLGVSEDTIYAMTKAGTLRYAVVGQRLKRIHRQDMERLRTEQPRDERSDRRTRSSRRTVSDEPGAPPGRLF